MDTGTEYFKLETPKAIHFKPTFPGAMRTDHQESCDKSSDKRAYLVILLTL